MGNDGGHWVTRVNLRGIFQSNATEILQISQSFSPGYRHIAMDDNSTFVSRGPHGSCRNHIELIIYSHDTLAIVTSFALCMSSNMQ